jgi:Ca2+/Na+ antiporter
MKKLDILATLLVIYALSLFFVLLQSQLDVSNIVVMLVILPLSYFVAMYMYLGIRELKHDSKQIMAVFKERLAIKEKQINSQTLIIKSLHEKIDELTVIKKELPFTDIVPYVNQDVGVFYGNGYIETYITKILDEKVTKYKCYKCGNRKYLLGELELLV